jgi:hypothetical protein
LFLLYSCSDLLLSADIESFIEYGLSIISLVDEDYGYISSDATSTIELQLINPNSLEANYELALISDEELLTSSELYEDFSEALSEKIITFKITPDSAAEHCEIDFSLDITATDTGRIYDTLYFSLSCDTPPGDVEDLSAGSYTISAEALVAFTLPENTTDDDLEFIEITYRNITDDTESETETIGAYDVSYQSISETIDFSVTDTGNELLRYFSPSGVSANDDYSFSVVLIDEAGQRSSAVTGSSNSEYLTITYDENGGSWENDPGTDYVVSGESFSLPSSEDISYSGYTLTGWSNDGGSSTYGDPSDSVSVTADTTFTAMWEEEEYTVTYHGYGTESTDTETYAEGDSVIVLVDSAYTGSYGTYSFAGWNSVDGSETTLYYDADYGDDSLSFEMGSGNVNLYAVWVDGTPIRTPQEMESLIPLNMGEDYYVTRDIDFSTEYLAADLSADDFPTIGSQSDDFSGSFNGLNHTLSNLTMTASEDYYGLFANVSGTISDLTITDATLVSEDYSYIGILAGKATGTISDCTISSSSITLNSTCGYVGAMIGYANGSTIEDTNTDEGHYTVSDITINSDNGNPSNNIGGLIGWLENSSSVSGCSASTITIDYCDYNTGGLIGCTDDSTVSECSITDLELVTASTSTSGEGYISNIGGLIGTVGDSSISESTSGSINITINHMSYNTGGLIGYITATDSADPCVVSDCTVNSSTITTATAIEGYATGGMIGQADLTSISSCSASDINITSYGDWAGGFIGYIFDSNITDSKLNFLTGNKISGMDYTGGFIGKFKIVDTGYYTIDKSSVYGDGSVESTGTSIGGLIGEIYSESTVSTLTIDQCYSALTLPDAGTNTGGLIGNIKVPAIDKLTVSNCYFYGIIHASALGLVGCNVDMDSDSDGYYAFSDSFSNCYSIAVDYDDSTNYLGMMSDGFDPASSDSTDDCYYLSDSGLTSSYGTSATANQLDKTETTTYFDNWNNVDIWGWISSKNSGYPYLLELEETY